MLKTTVQKFKYRIETRLYCDVCDVKMKMTTKIATNCSPLQYEYYYVCPICYKTEKTSVFYPYAEEVWEDIE